MNSKALKARQDFELLLQHINSVQRKGTTFLIGIDGCGGSGKSTLSANLKERLPNATVVHKDDFYLPASQILKTDPKDKPIGADFDGARFLKQVLVPLSQNKEGHYQRYDWDRDALAEWHTIPAGGTVIIEGVYSLRKEFFDCYDCTIWVECPRDIRLARGLERDGEAARDRWVKNWMVSEDVYMDTYKPFLKADLLVSGIE